MRNLDPFAIRPAVPEDAADLSTIENQIFSGDRISLRSFRRLLAQTSAVVLVAAVGNRIAGYAMALFRRNSSIARLYSIAVDPGHARHGLGKALLKAAEDAARHRNCVVMRLEVREDNAAAIRLYGASGYLPAGRVADYYEDGCAAVRFEKPLTTSNREVQS